MSAALASFFSAWLIETAANLHTNSVVLVVVLALTTGRASADLDRKNRMIGACVLPPAAMLATEVDSLMNHHLLFGDTAFSLCLGAAIWIRRFGLRFSRVGTQATLPFIAILVSPVLPSSGLADAGWAALMACVAVIWVTTCQYAGRRLGTVSHVAHIRTVPTGPRLDNGRSRHMRPIARTRMAVQMTLTVGAGFALGHHISSNHWTWFVLTAHIVAVGNRGRHDVVQKGKLRALGATAGTAVATVLSELFHRGDRRAVVTIFVALAVATWLRSLSYAYWAGASQPPSYSCMATSARAEPRCSNTDSSASSVERQQR